MLTVRSDAQSVRTGIERGAEAALTKPFDFPDLIHFIELCLWHSTMPALR